MFLPTFHKLFNKSLTFFPVKIADVAEGIGSLSICGTPLKIYPVSEAVKRMTFMPYLFDIEKKVLIKGVSTVKWDQLFIKTNKG